MTTRATAATAGAPKPGDAAPAVQRIADLPGPRSWPWLGNIPQLRPDRLHQQLEQWAEVHGTFYCLRFGRRRVVVLSDHALVAALLRDRPEGFRRTELLERVWTELGLPGGVFGARGESWKRQRRMVMAGFDPGHVRRYLPQLQTVAARLVERWTAAAQQGRAIDLQADLMRYTVDTIAGLAFGAEVDTLRSDGDIIQSQLDKIFPEMQRRLLSPLPTWRWWRSAADRRTADSIAQVLRAVDGFIEQARTRLQDDPQRRAQPANLLEAMLVAAGQSDSGIVDADVAGNVLTMLLAGEDTTANTIAWALDLLWRRPEMLVRATAEVRAALPRDCLPSHDTLAQLPFIEACLHETMRLKPVAPLLNFQAERDTTIGTLQVPARTVILTLMRRDSVSRRHLRDAQSFEPARWLGGAGGVAGLGSDAGGLRRLSMPFGAGPRICPGRYLALVEMKMALAVLLSRFEIESIDTPDGLPARERLSFTMVPVGLHMRLRLRA
ncbi:MAG: cytochrome P450 [Rubrivivax sp.]